MGSGRRDLLRSVVFAAGTGVLSGLQMKAQEKSGSARLFPGFKASRVETKEAVINVVSAGSGPPLLLLHGAPQTLATWHKIAPQLAANFTVVAADLRGYGDSSKPPDGVNHSGYSKRAMAQDQVEVMEHFGFKKFAVVGHDRGARVAHRMALDHGERVTRAVVLDIVPTYKLFQSVNLEFASSYYHFFFLTQPAPFPETLIGNSLEFFMGGEKSETQAEYLRCMKDPATLHAMCEDYRAAATIDLEHDRADLNRKIECPLLVLWAERGGTSPAQRAPIRPMGQMFDMLSVWRERAKYVRGKGLPGGHALQELVPEETLAELQAFLRS